MLVPVEAGAGRPLVLVHGWGSNSSLWERVVPALASALHVIAVDLPGFGRSPAGDGDLERDLRDLLDERDLSDVLLVGWSMGGVVALAYHERFRAHRLAGLGIVDVSPRAREAHDWHVGEAVGSGFGEGLDRWVSMWPDGREEVFRELNTLAFADPEKHADEIGWLVEQSMSADPDAALAALLRYADRDLRRALAEIELPTLLVFGGRSTSTTPWVSDYMRAEIPHSELIVLEDSGHALMLEEPERFARAVLDFEAGL